MIYLDYQATTPVCARVSVKAMTPWIEEKFAKPALAVALGHEAEARQFVAGRARKAAFEEAIGLKGGSLAFTGSATEALNWALKGTVREGRRRDAAESISLFATEHAAVLDTCEWLAGQGVDLTILRGAARWPPRPRAPGPRSSTSGSSWWRSWHGQQCRSASPSPSPRSQGWRTMRRQRSMLCDAVQAFGRIERSATARTWWLSRPTDPRTVPGDGALWMRRAPSPRPSFHGGGQERGLRSAPCRRRFALASGQRRSCAEERMTRDYDHVQKLWNAAVRALGPRWTIDGSISHRLSGQSQHPPGRR